VLPHISDTHIFFQEKATTKTYPNWHEAYTLLHLFLLDVKCPFGRMERKKLKKEVSG